MSYRIKYLAFGNRDWELPDKDIATLWITEDKLLIGRQKNRDPESVDGIDKSVVLSKEYFEEFSGAFKEMYQHCLKKNRKFHAARWIIENRFLYAIPMKNRTWKIRAGDRIVYLNRSELEILLGEFSKAVYRNGFFAPPVEEEKKNLTTWRNSYMISAARQNAERSQLIHNQQHPPKSGSVEYDPRIHREVKEVYFDGLTQIKTLSFRCPGKHAALTKFWQRVEDRPPDEENHIGFLHIRCSNCGHERKIYYTIKRPRSELIKKNERMIEQKKEERKPDVVWSS